MVNFNNLANTSLTASKTAASTSNDAPATGFAALFAALQSQASAPQDKASQQALQQLAQHLEQAQTHAEIDTDGLTEEPPELSPEALQQLLAFVQQQQPQPQPQPQSQPTPAAAVNPTVVTQVNAPNKAAEPPVFTTPVTTPVVNPEQTDSRVAATPLTAELLPLDRTTPIDPSRPAQLAQVAPQTQTATQQQAAAPAPAPTFTANVVMIDAPVAQAAQTSAPTPSTTAANASLAAPVGSQAWASQLQQNVMQMVMHNQNEMTLRLHPAELGPLQVQLRMDDSTAQLNILTHSHQVRGALEQALPMLREALANQGIQLGDSQVNDNNQQFAQQQEHQQAQQWSANQQNNTQSTSESAELAENTDKGPNSRHTAASLNGQIDTFA